GPQQDAVARRAGQRTPQGPYDRAGHALDLPGPVPLGGRRAEGLRGGDDEGDPRSAGSVPDRPHVGPRAGSPRVAAGPGRERAEIGAAAGSGLRTEYSLLSTQYGAPRCILRCKEPKTALTC